MDHTACAISTSILSSPLLLPLPFTCIDDTNRMSHVLALALCQVRREEISAILERRVIPQRVHNDVTPDANKWHARKKRRSVLRWSIIRRRQPVAPRCFEKRDVFARGQHYAWCQKRPFQVSGRLAGDAFECETMFFEQWKAVPKFVNHCRNQQQRSVSEILTKRRASSLASLGSPTPSCRLGTST